MSHSAKFIPQGIKISYSEGNRIQPCLQESMFSIPISGFLCFVFLPLISNDRRTETESVIIGSPQVFMRQDRWVFITKKCWSFGRDLKTEVLLEALWFVFAGLREAYSLDYFFAWSACNPAFCKAWDLKVLKVVLCTQVLILSHFWAWSLLWDVSVICIKREGRLNQLGIQKLLLILQVLKASLSYKAGVYVIHIQAFSRKGLAIKWHIWW